MGVLREGGTYRRGFPISLLMVPHSTRVSFLVFSLGKDSFRHRQNSLSPSNRGLDEMNKKERRQYKVNI